MSDAAVPLHAPLADTRSTYRKIGLRILPFIILAYLTAYLDRVNIGFAKLQMQSDLHYSDAIYGLGAGIFFLGYFLCEVPSNLALRRFGARVWIARIMITWAVLSGLTAFVVAPWQFYAVRFLLGLAEAGFSPGMTYYIMQWFPAERRGRANAWYFIAIPLSGVIGGPLSGWILNNLTGFHGMMGWQWLFLAEAVPSLLLGVVTLFYLDDSVASARWLTPAEKATVQRALAAEDTGKHQHRSVRAFAGDGRLWLLSAVYFCTVMGLYALSFWVPSIIKSAGVHDNLTNGLLSALPYLITVGAILITGTMADQLKRRRGGFALAMVVGGLGLIGSMLAGNNLALAMVGLTFACCGVISSVSLFWSLPPNFLRGASAAAGIAAINSIGNLAGFVSPYAVGWLNVRTGDAKTGMYLIAGFLIFGALLVTRVPRRLVDR